MKYPMDLNLFDLLDEVERPWPWPKGAYNMALDRLSPLYWEGLHEDALA